MAIGKGWFHFEETNRDTYEFSKLKKFLTLTRVMMQDVIRTLVEQSLEQLVSFVEMVCSADVRVLGTDAVTCEFPSSTPKHYRSPILTLELEINQTKTGFQYSTDLNEVRPAVASLSRHEPQVLPLPA